jgi:hypothetical protein
LSKFKINNLRSWLKEEPVLDALIECNIVSPQLKKRDATQLERSGSKRQRISSPLGNDGAVCDITTSSNKKENIMITKTEKKISSNSRLPSLKLTTSNNLKLNSYFNMVCQVCGLLKSDRNTILAVWDGSMTK